VNPQTYQQFAEANHEFSEFLRKVDGLTNGTESVTEGDLQSLSQSLAALAPMAGEVLAAQAHDNEQQNDVTEYIRNLRSLQTALETVHCVMLARKTQLDGARRHLHGVQGWVNAYQQTT